MIAWDVRSTCRVKVRFDPGGATGYASIRPTAMTCGSATARSTSPGSSTGSAARVAATSSH